MCSLANYNLLRYLRVYNLKQNRALLPTRLFYSMYWNGRTLHSTVYVVSETRKELQKMYFSLKNCEDEAEYFTAATKELEIDLLLSISVHNVYCYVMCSSRK